MTTVVIVVKPREERSIPLVHEVGEDRVGTLCETTLGVLNEVVGIQAEHIVEYGSVDTHTELLTGYESEVIIVSSLGKSGVATGCAVMPLPPAACITLEAIVSLIEIVVGDIDVLMELGSRCCELELVDPGSILLNELLLTHAPSERHSRREGVAMPGCELC